ncbi:MAG TPA: FAD/NAD(P)-binding oxidoreductase [Ignavibacteria bacterium]
MKKIVILGGGVGGIVTANELIKRLNTGHKVIVIEKNKEHAFAPSFLWLMTGSRKKENIKVDISSLLQKGVEIINEEVLEINIDEKLIGTSNRKIDYDYLIVALGAAMHPESIPGNPSGAHNYYTLEGAEKLYHGLQKFTEGKIAVVITSLPFKCPAAPYEGALLISDFFETKNIRDKIDISIYTPEPFPMPVGGPGLGEAVKQVLASKHINLHTQHKIFEVDNSRKELLFEANGKYGYDMLVIIPPHKAPSVIQHSELAGQSGWIPVDRSTLQTKFPNVYAIGDVTSITIPGKWKPDVPLMLPKAGIFAHLQAEIAAERISSEINGEVPKTVFCGDGFCMLEAGEHSAGFAYGNFFGEPSPDVKIRNVGKSWHYGKIIFEKWWLSSFGIKKSLLKFLMKIGSSIMRIPIKF